MKERVHEQITNDLRQISRNDTTVIIIDIIVTFIFFGLAAGFAANTVQTHYGFATNEPTKSLSTLSTIIMFVSLAVVIVMNWFSLMTFSKNLAQKTKLAENLAKLYQEDNLNQYDSTIAVSSFKTRRSIYAAMLGILTSAAVVITIVIFINQLVTEL
jgi:uncharacterized membrane protein YkgB